MSNTKTTQYFLTLAFHYTHAENKTAVDVIVPCVVETDVDEERKGIFVWLFDHGYENLLHNNRTFQDGLYNSICQAIFGYGIDAFFNEHGGTVIKAPSGSTWSQHVAVNTAYTTA